MRRTLSAALLLAASGAFAAPTAEDLWFFADFDSLPRLNGAAFTEPLVDGHEDKGRFGKGHAFVVPGKRGDEKFWRITDPAVIDTFPRERGAFACWFRSPEDCLDRGESPGFGFVGYWQFQWVWRGGAFNTGTAYGEGVRIKDFKRSTEWRHFAAVWNDEKLVVYLNGEKAGEKAKPQRMDMTDVPRRVLRIGSGFDGGPAANLVMDEIAIFSRDLSPDEVKGLATAKGPLFAKPDPVMLTGVTYPIYWRNQDDAAIRTRVISDAGRELTVRATIAGKAVPERRITVAKGETRLAIPFDPARLRAGKYPWAFSLVDAAGRRLAGASGEMEIRPRVERHRFKVMDWGGYRPLSVEFMHAVGINACNAGWRSPESIRRLVRSDISPNVNYNDKRRLPKGTLFDADEAMRRTDREFAPLEGLHLWSETLLNTEIYGAPVGAETGNVKFVEFARRQLGREPDFRYTGSPIGINPKTIGTKWPKGVIRRGDCPQLDTLCWALEKGHPDFLLARAEAKAIRALQPDNVVWSEPMFEGLAAGLDMVADWQYEYSTEFVLRDTVMNYAPCRAYGKFYQPTLSPSYWDPQIFGWHPTVKDKDGKPQKIRMCQSADEVAIKAWMVLSAVPTHSLALYETDMWEWGLKGAATNGREHTYAEPDVVERYGRMWKERIAPVADLFRDMPNARAPLAIVILNECQYSIGNGYCNYHYPNQLALALAPYGLPYDFVCGHELETAGLAGYRYALLPMAQAIYEEHVKDLEAAAAKGVTIVTDKYAAKTFANGVHLDKLDHPWTPREFPRLHKTLQDWYGPLVPELRRAAVAWSDCDGTNGFTFVKQLDGVRYVSVVNDRRSDDPGYLGQFVTNAWYRPMGAPQRITTHIKVPKGGQVYEFNSKDCSIVRLKDCSIAAEYGPAEGKVFCVYPKALKKLSVSREGDALEVTLVDVDGEPAPGRQVVEVEVRDPSGALHDETGRYVMEKGRLVVPLRFADDDPPRGLFSAWTASVRELTTGFTDDCKIR